MEQTFYPDRLGYSVVCVGAGGIGSHVLPMLVRAGVQHLTIYDDDKVGEENLQMQNFDAEDIGRFKVYVMEWRLKKINPKVHIRASTYRFTGKEPLDGIVLSAVDSMQSRKEIFDSVGKGSEHIALLIDGRLTRDGAFVDLYFIDPKNEHEMLYYSESLFDDSQGHYAPRPDCMMAHVPLMLTGLIGEVLARWVVDRCHPWKVTYDAVAHHTERYYVQRS